jgi:hypothetical protein
MPIRLAVIFLLFSATGFATSKDLDFGGMVLSVSDAPTAQIFHIVDQLSQWDIYTHDQYALGEDEPLPRSGGFRIAPAAC